MWSVRVCVCCVLCVCLCEIERAICSSHSFFFSFFLSQTTNLQTNPKEKCRKFLANLLELSSREPKPVAQNVCTLIQELIDANVEPDEFCDRLERLLNASPQPCLIGFLKVNNICNIYVYRIRIFIFF